MPKIGNSPVDVSDRAARDNGSVDIGESALPAGAATEDAQDTGNTSIDSVDTKFGEVQATPTANTLLRRLKDLLTGIVLAESTAIIGVVKSWVNQQTLVTKSVDIEASQTGTTIWDPTSGKKFVITDIHLSTSAAGLITIFDHTDDAANRVLKASSDGDGWGLEKAYKKPRISAAADNILKYTTGTVVAGYLTVQGYEV